MTYLDPNKEEHENTILVAVIDETYGQEEEDWDQAREEFRLSLVEEYDCSFSDGDVGPSASLPVFITVLLVVVGVLLPLFFSGKRIEENFDSWRSMYRRLRRFSKRRIVVGRNGAAVLALGELIKFKGEEPTELKLLSYRVGDPGASTVLADFDRSEEIMEPVDTLFLGQMSHVFELQFNGQAYRVAVEGSEATICQLK